MLGTEVRRGCTQAPGRAVLEAVAPNENHCNEIKCACMANIGAWPSTSDGCPRRMLDLLVLSTVDYSRAHRDGVTV